ncbi:hypothetical protein OUZ56_025123 [Daphnia magna]|uniref:Uncharacterized protein n=1 Tax=Daphnia magna TaxID=35525 RepID=A0ABQ9ZIY2_9CRUS|nr:hypothetical protein OUZ56_025123 [Daphnia magna]
MMVIAMRDDASVSCNPHEMKVNWATSPGNAPKQDTSKICRNREKEKEEKKSSNEEDVRTRA